MDSGLIGENSLEFNVSWTDISHAPNAEINIDPETVVAHIKPYCEAYNTVFYKVVQDGDVYSVTTEVVEMADGYPLEDEDLNDIFTTTGEQVFQGLTTDDDSIFYTTIDEPYLLSGVTLSVYRREYDGTFKEIATGIDNTRNTFVTDPHPALDLARYRIVAITESTGAVSFSDLPGVPTGEVAVILQWNEEWSNFDTSSEDEMVEPAWAGSMLKLPYNIDVSDSHSPDIALIEYIGRRNPVSYYGTQLGETARWDVEIPKYDKETLYGLRRLAIWMGDVYVREPSGSGYWANVTVSFSQKHCEVTIPVSLDIARVEGGV